MKKHLRGLSLFVCLLLLIASAAQAAGWNTNLTMRLSTRTGPSTSYTEPGTFFSNWQGVGVKVFSKAQGNGVWWVQVEFQTGGKLYRAYTGAKRVTMDISAVPEERIIGMGYVRLAGDADGYYGPGTHYAPLPHPVPAGINGTIISSENGYVLFDFYDSRLGMQRRAWVYADYMTIDWYYDQPTGSYTPIASGNHAGNLYYAADGSGICCQVLSVGRNGQYSYIDIYAYGNSYLNLPVYMESAKYGSFGNGEVGGNITFLNDGLFAELYFPRLDISLATRMNP